MGAPRILLVDNVHQSRRNLASALRRAGQEVMEAKSPLWAIAVSRQLKPDAMIVEDRGAFGIDAAVLTQTMRREGLLAPTLWLLNDASRSQKAIDAGVRMLSKPFDVDEALKALANLVGVPYSTMHPDVFHRTRRSLRNY